MAVAAYDHWVRSKQDFVFFRSYTKSSGKILHFVCLRPKRGGFGPASFDFDFDFGRPVFPQKVGTAANLQAMPVPYRRPQIGRTGEIQASAWAGVSTNGAGACAVYIQKTVREGMIGHICSNG